MSNLDDDFAAIPEQNGKPMIFMVGCGHIEDGEWQFSCFVADRLETSCADIIEQWFDYMQRVRRRVGSPCGTAARVPLVTGGNQQHEWRPQVSSRS